MPVLSGGDLSNIRTQPIGRLFNLYVYQPVTVWTGTVGGSPSRGDRALTVATATGNPADILADSTVRVTDSADALKGYPSKVRAKSYGAPTLTIADNDIDWAAGDKLIAVRLFEIWPRIPYIDATDVDNPIIYKDRDIAWADDDTSQPPKANAGPAAIGELNGGICDIVFKNEGSFIVPTGAAVTSHLWDAIGGSPNVQAGAENTDTVTYRYDTAGYYYVKYTVTDGNGKTGHVYVPVIIDDGTYPISRAWPGDRYWDKNGWILSRRLSGIDADPDKFVDGSPVFLVADTQITGAGAFTDNRSNLRWAGWLISDETKRGAYERETNFRMVSSCHILRTIPAFPVGLRSDGSPADWYEYTQLNLDSVAFLLLHWQSTVLQICDYHPDGDWTNRLRPGENCRADDVLTQVNATLAAMFADLRCDRQGILRVMRDEWHLSAAEEAARDTVMTLANTDYQNVRYGPRLHRARVREIRALGVDGSDNPYISGAPGEAPLDGGRPGEVTKLSPKTQAELNQWAGQELSTENWSIPLVLRMAGEFDAIDPALGEYIDGTLSGFDDKLPDGPYSVVGVRFIDDSETRLTMSEWELLADPTAYGGHDGETRDIPEIPDPPDPPDLPEDPPIPIILPPGWPLQVYVATATAGVYYTANFTGPAGDMPTWAEVRAKSGDGDITAIRQLKVDLSAPADYQYIMTETVDEADREVYRRQPGVSNGEWVKIFDLAAADVLWAGCDFLGWIESDEGIIYVSGAKQGAFDPNKPLFAVFKSVDHGDNWTTFDDGIDRGIGLMYEAYYAFIGHGVHLYHAWREGGGGATARVVHSHDGGASWDFTDDVANGHIFLALNYADPGHAFYSPDASSNLSILNANNTHAILQAALGINLASHCMWNSPTDAEYMRLLFDGKLYSTTDQWTTVEDAAPDAITQGIPNGFAPFVASGDDDMMIVGVKSLSEENPHTVGILYGDDDTTFDGKAGDDTVDGPPYTNSIPRTCGGIVRNGVQVVDWT